MTTAQQLASQAKRARDATARRDQLIRQMRGEGSTLRSIAETCGLHPHIEDYANPDSRDITIYAAWPHLKGPSSSGDGPFSLPSALSDDSVNVF